MQRITPFLWFTTEAEEAASLYVSIFPNSSITNIDRYGEGAPLPAGTAFSVSFILDGVEFHALNAEPGFPFTEAVSFFVTAETQPEIDRLWDALTADGGQPSRCGWLKDKFGLSWQIVPPILSEVLGGADAAGSARAMQAMLGMGKLDIAALERAYAGN